MTIDRQTASGALLNALGVLVLGLVATTIGCGTAGETSRTRYTEGVDLYQDGDLHGAARAYREAIGEKPDDFRAHYNLAVVHHDLFAREKEKVATNPHFTVAEEEYKKTLALDAGNPRAISGLAVLYSDAGDAQKAMDTLTNAKVSGDEGSANVAWTRGSLLAAKGDVAGAKAAYRDVLASDEKHAPAATINT